MAAVADCIITNSVEGKGAYAIRVDNDENVYVPVSVAEKLDLEEFETVQAIMIRNDRTDPPWRAIRVRRAEGDDEN
jgi:hypothetical protein